jgi:hypothetical protein
VFTSPGEVAVSRRTAHAPRHTPADGASAIERVSRILSEKGEARHLRRAPRFTMFNQRQEIKRKATLANRAHAMRHQPTPSEPNYLTRHSRAVLELGGDVSRACRISLRVMGPRM